MKLILKILLICGLAAMTWLQPFSTEQGITASSLPDKYVGNAACARCHAEIYKTFSATPMANSSGVVGADDFQENLTGSEFFHAKSGLTYRINKERGVMYLDFERAPSEKSADGINGRRRLEFFIGSGAHGRGYVYALDGFLFQLPVGYYSQAKKWDMSPGYEVGKLMKLSRPIQQGCLECHASNLRPIAGTENRFESKPFLENGISCERCHGPGDKHTAAMKSGAVPGGVEIVNPAKLAPARRDSICAQCHLSGAARVEKTGRSLQTFRPGDLLADHLISFVLATTPNEKLSVTGHVETLQQSRCKQESGDRLSCTTCHNPHFRPAPAAAAGYFNQKCASCHQVSTCKSDPRLRDKNGNDCVNCHMPKRPTQDIGHNVFTDHSIPRAIPRAIPQATTQAIGAKATVISDYARQTLTSFWGGQVYPRDLGMAYLSVASKTSDAGYARAAELLKKVEPELNHDAQALTFLGKIYEREKNYERAARCYEKAVKADPSKTEAGVNLGTIYARGGRLFEAIKLWEDVLSRNPGYEIARLNLAFAHLENGNFNVAKVTLLKALEYDPDLPIARKILADLDSIR